MQILCTGFIKGAWPIAILCLWRYFCPAMEGDYMEQGRFVFVRMFLNRGDQLFFIVQSSRWRDGRREERTRCKKKLRDWYVQLYIYGARTWIFSAQQPKKNTGTKRTSPAGEGCGPENSWVTLFPPKCAKCVNLRSKGGPAISLPPFRKDQISESSQMDISPWGMSLNKWQIEPSQNESDIQNTGFGFYMYRSPQKRVFRRSLTWIRARKAWAIGRWAWTSLVTADFQVPISYFETHFKVREPYNTP